jgi:hypothetical protein
MVTRVFVCEDILDFFEEIFRYLQALFVVSTVGRSDSNAEPTQGHPDIGSYTPDG